MNNNQLDSFFDNEAVLKHFKKSNLDDISYALELCIYHVSKDISDILLNNLAITCYGSDSRLDRSNTNSNSIDLLVCNNNLELSNEKVISLVKNIISNTEGIVEENFYHEEGFNGEVDLVEDNREIGTIISKLQNIGEYIDVLSTEDELYKYKNKYFPDRLIDAYCIGGNKTILEEFKLNMLDDIINNTSIYIKFRSEIKKYFKEEFIRGKNHRNGLDNSFVLYHGVMGLIKFDGEQYFGFKHGPIRALQYKITEKFLKLVIDSKDINLIRTYPYDILSRLEFLKNHKLLGNLDLYEIREIFDIYNLFIDLNISLEFLFNSDLNSYKKITKTLIDGNFNIDIDNKIKYTNMLDRFIELFNKI